MPRGRLHLGGIPLDPMTLSEASEFVLARSATNEPMAIVSTINLQFLRTARYDEAFAHVLRNESALNLIDGAPVIWALRRRGHRHVTRAPGADLTNYLLKSERARPLGLFLLGDEPQTISALRERARNEKWNRNIRGAETPSPDEVDNERSSEAIVNRINQSGARILLVAFGAPRQELWLKRWRGSLMPRVAIGIGGSLKFIADPTRRAPQWMRRCGLEWLHRVSLEPRRLLPRYSRDALELARLLVGD